MSRSSRKRKRAERKRSKERAARRDARASTLRDQERELNQYGLFINTNGVELLLPRARIQCP